MKINLSPDLSLPPEALTQRFAFLARVGAGKTYTATKMAEEMAGIGGQIVAIDRVGVWYGLRLDSTGKHPSGLEIPVFGGEHGDLPLSHTSGALIARLVVEKNISAILDVSQFRKGEARKFSTDFGEELFHLKKSHRSPVHLFLEEAQWLVPQRLQGGERDDARMLGAWEDVIRLGRNYGIGVSLISQRPQSVNKEVLNQTEVVVALQTNGLQERKAIADWTMEKGVESDNLGTLLPSLEIGQAHIWSPSWLRISKTIRISQKKTYDASATPKFGESIRKVATLAPMDVQAILDEMQEVVKEQESKDPILLKRRIAELERAACQAKQAPAPVQTKTVQVPIVDAADLKRMEKILARVDTIKGKASEALTAFTSLVNTVKGTVQLANAAPKIARMTPDEKRQIEDSFRKSPPIIQRSSILDNVPAMRELCVTNVTAFDSLPKASREILRTLKQFGKCAKSKLAVISGYAVNGGAFNNGLGAARSQGLVTGSDPINLTESGLSITPHSDPLPRGLELVQFWMNSVELKASREILSALHNRHPNPLTREELALASGYEAKGGAFNNGLGRLRTLELIQGRDPIQLADTIFD